MCQVMTKINEPIIINFVASPVLAVACAQIWVHCFLQLTPFSLWKMFKSRATKIAFLAKAGAMLLFFGRVYLLVFVSFIFFEMQSTPEHSNLQKIKNKIKL